MSYTINNTGKTAADSFEKTDKKKNITEKNSPRYLPVSDKLLRT